MLKDQTQGIAEQDSPISLKTCRIERMDQPRLFLRILAGPQMGTRAVVREGLTIGRKEGDLIVKDPKMSVQHARIEWRTSEWVLVDLGSSNKIKVDDQRYGEVVIYPGLQLIIGSTQIEVLERPSSDIVKDDDQFEFTASIEVAAEEAPVWHEIISEVLSRASGKAQEFENQSAPPKIRPFPMALRLEFVSGVQHGTTWNLGYGPREAGAASFDLPLFDDAAADSCFLLDTAEGKVLFRAASDSIVRLNGSIASTEPIELRSGDRIEFGKTRIRVLVE